MWGVLISPFSRPRSSRTPDAAPRVALRRRPARGVLLERDAAPGRRGGRRVRGGLGRRAPRTRRRRQEADLGAADDAFFLHRDQQRVRQQFAAGDGPEALRLYRLFSGRGDSDRPSRSFPDEAPSESYTLPMHATRTISKMNTMSTNEHK